MVIALHIGIIHSDKAQPAYLSRFTKPISLKFAPGEPYFPRLPSVTQPSKIENVKTS
jgi:hypothetical protein